MVKRKPVLTVDDWIEIDMALDSKIRALEKAKAALAEGHGTAAALIELKAQKGRSK